MNLIDSRDHAFVRRHYDVGIIGSGAAGLYLADRLSNRLSVCILESGGLQESEDNQALNDVVQTGKTLSASRWGRKRVVGGTTTAWGGQSLPFSELDFEPRSWVNAPAWPIRRAALSRHYAAANDAMGIDEIEEDAELLKLLGLPLAPFGQELIRYHVSKWAPEPNFAKIFGKAHKTYDLYHNCHVIGLNVIDGAVRGVRVSNSSSERSISCTWVILAAGGLESNRLVMLIDQQHNILSADQKQLAGRGFMDHPCLTIGQVETSRPYALQRLLNTHVHSGRKYSLRMSASPALQRAEKILNVSASLLPRPDFNGPNPYSDFRKLSVYLRHPRFAVDVALAGGTSLAAIVRDRFVYRHKWRNDLVIMAEQEPSPLSRLRLATQKDRYGQAFLDVGWYITPLTWKSVRTFAAKLRGEIEKAGLGSASLIPELDRADFDGVGLLTDVNHHMGGLIMGSDSTKSIVDPELRLHALHNVYICSSAVFPTGSHSNPTLTILALADRLADHLLTQG